MNFVLIIAFYLLYYPIQIQILHIELVL